MVTPAAGAGEGRCLHPHVPLQGRRVASQQQGGCLGGALKPKCSVAAGRCCYLGAGLSQERAG